ncbi:MAG: MarR family transcriptional regulator [Rhodocyclaceae bacterium]|nr:MarR family transcriptional regulator [Rhodocyclaceae bacterium]MBX3670205.1 MarR family transcriptional regulator [Rhodocyclaceae bacterium]
MQKKATPAKENTVDTALDVLQRFRVLIRAAQRHSQWVEKRTGLSGAQLWVLQELAEVPGLRVGELADCMALHQSTASNLVDKLETGGLLRRERTAADQRVVKLYLTEKGQAMIAKAPAPARGILPEALRKLEAERLTALGAELNHLLAQIRSLDEAYGKEPLPFTL